MSRHATFPVGRGRTVNSGEAMATGVGVVVSSDGIDGGILTGFFVPIESPVETPSSAEVFIY